MYRISDGVRSTRGKDGAVVLDIRQGQMFNLNLVGSRVFELLRNGSCEPEIVDFVVREYHVSRELAEADVLEFIEILRKHRLIEEQKLGESS